MNCMTCGLEISPQFKFALEKNECPGCGKEIMSDEMIGLIESVKETISSTVTLKNKTAHRLALALVSSYSMEPLSPDQFDHGGGNKENSETPDPPKESPPVPKKTEEEILKDRIAKKVMLEKYYTKEEISRLKDIEIDNMNIDDFFENTQVEEEDDEDQKRSLVDAKIQRDLKKMSKNLKGENVNLDAGDGFNPILEQQKLERIKKAQAALNGGAGVVRRSS